MDIEERRKLEKDNRRVERENIGVYYGTGKAILIQPIWPMDVHNDLEITDEQAIQLRDILNELYPREDK